MATDHYEENSKLPHDDPNFRALTPPFYRHPTPEEAEAQRREKFKDENYVNSLRWNMGQRDEELIRWRKSQQK